MSLSFWFVCLFGPPLLQLYDLLSERHTATYF
uniref:Uncharacterized protein n=1 Tax=Zea mays TaxID=4577 RepID=B6TTJ0_MAIZE|nr:hypothetical protein [Zea mays]